MGHRSVPCSFCPNLGHSKGGLPTPLPGMAWIPRPGFCFGRLLSAHTVCLYVPYRLFCCPGSTSIKSRSASMGIRQSYPGARSPGSACLTVLPAPSASHSRRARNRLFRTIALEPRCNTSRQLRHNANAVLEIFLMQKGSLLMHQRDESALRYGISAESNTSVAAASRAIRSTRSSSPSPVWAENRTASG